MCDCQNVAMGSYDAHVELEAPPWSRHATLGIDACLVEEVQALWAEGIQTVASCCGHNTAPPVISVRWQDVPRMVAMGYEFRFNPCYPEGLTDFIPKTVS